MWSLSTFYSSKEWLAFRDIVIHNRLNEEGISICEHCHKPIVKAYDLILHHIEELTEDNVNDVAISLNEDNIQIVHFGCHNKIHDRLGLSGDSKKVYLVYGPPLCGAIDWVSDVKNDGDIIVDMDSIWQCISGCDRYVKSNRLKSNAFGIRDTLLEMIKYRRGHWRNAYVIGGYPLISERQRLCRMLGATEIFIDVDREECIKRLMTCEDVRRENMKDWMNYIDDWFYSYSGPPTIK